MKHEECKKTIVALLREANFDTLDQILDFAQETLEKQDGREREHMQYGDVCEIAEAFSEFEVLVHCVDELLVDILPGISQIIPEFPGTFEKKLFYKTQVVLAYEDMVKERFQLLLGELTAEKK